MSNRERNVLLKVYVSENEAALIQAKMEQCNARNFSEYARKMLIDGYIIHQDYTGIREVAKEMSYLNRSINQIAKRANETRNIYEQDIIDLQKDVRKMKGIVSERLIKMAKRGR